MNILLLIIVIIAVIVIGGGLGLLLYFRMQPKRETWTAYVYGVGEGVKNITTDKGGNLIGTFKLKDLIPYKKDVLIKLNKAHGVTVYKLSGLGLTTQQPSPDAVDVWGNGERVIDVLVVGNNATILKKGYDTDLGEQIFRPMPRELLEMVISEAEIKINDIDGEKSLIQQILPWIGLGMMVLGIVASAYLNGQAIIESSKRFEASNKYTTDTMKELVEATRADIKAQRDASTQITENNLYGKQPSNTTKQEDTIK